MELSFTSSCGKIFKDPGGIARDVSIGRHLFGNHVSRADSGVLSDNDPSQESRPGTDRCAPLHNGALASPVRFRLNLPICIRRSRIPVVDESNIVANEHFGLNRHSLANKCMAGYLAAGADFRSLLNLDKGANSSFVSDFATVEVQ